MLNRSAVPGIKTSRRFLEWQERAHVASYPFTRPKGSMTFFAASSYLFLLDPIIKTRSQVKSMTRFETLIDVVRFCSNTKNPESDKGLIPIWSSEPTQDGAGVIGYMLHSIAKLYEDTVKDKPELQCFFKTAGLMDDQPAYAFAGKTADERSAALAALAQHWREQGALPDPLDGWRNELYAIYGPRDASTPHSKPNPWLSLERSACALFGFATFGVHGTAYTPDYQIWVPRRAKTKSTWPGYLDNTVAGGITAGDDPFESMVRECGEEAGLEPELVRKCMKQTGVISYFYTTELGYLQPEVEFTYDIALAADVVPHPVDGEAESFELLSVQACIESMLRGEWKANSACVLIDFLMRHGLITYENAGCDYLALSNALHVDLRLPSC